MPILLDEAAASFTSATEIALQNEDRFILAYARRALGEVKMIEGDAKTGRELLAAARELFSELSLPWDAE